MSSFTSSTCVEQEVQVSTIFKNVLSSSSEEPPTEEWSSLIVRTPPDNPKMALFKLGAYDPGSGEICGKYIPMSDSTVGRHPYYNYPGVKDPGIMEALNGAEPKKTYDHSGQDLYLALCKQMDVIPVRGFHRGLLEKVIDLRYYGINPVGVRAMCLSLTQNTLVRRLDLTSNRLSNDACYHLGKLLGENFALMELVLSGCRIQEAGILQLVVSLSKRKLNILDLSKNDIGDAGFAHLACQIAKGAVINRLNLSYNGLTDKSATVFAEALDNNNTILFLDLSWNKIFPVTGSNDLLRMLGGSKVLVELNIAWNGLTTGVVLRKVLGIPSLKILDVSNNRLSTAAVKAIVARLRVAKNLDTLDLSRNPLRPAEAFCLVDAMRDKEVKLKNLLMEDVAVTKEFVVALNDVMKLKYRRNLRITYGRVLCNYTISQPDMRDIVMRRIDFITARATKKCQLDIAVYFLREYKDNQFMESRKLLRTLKLASAPVEEDLIEELAKAFPGPNTDKGGRTINLEGVVEYIQRLWPDKKPPPTPPPVLEPVKGSTKNKTKKK